MKQASGGLLTLEMQPPLWSTMIFTPSWCVIHSRSNLCGMQITSSCCIVQVTRQGRTVRCFMGSMMRTLPGGQCPEQHKLCSKPSVLRKAPEVCFGLRKFASGSGSLLLDISTCVAVCLTTQSCDYDMGSVFTLHVIDQGTALVCCIYVELRLL